MHWLNDKRGRFVIDLVREESDIFRAGEEEDPD